MDTFIVFEWWKTWINEKFWYKTKFTRSCSVFPGILTLISDRQRYCLMRNKKLLLLTALQFWYSVSFIPEIFCKLGVSFSISAMVHFLKWDHFETEHSYVSSQSCFNVWLFARYFVLSLSYQASQHMSLILALTFEKGAEEKGSFSAFFFKKNLVTPLALKSFFRKEVYPALKVSYGFLSPYTLNGGCIYGGGKRRHFF